MKNLTLKISIGALVIMFAVMMYSVATLKAESGGGSDTSGICGLSSSNIYASEDLDTEDIQELYHEEMNKKFNNYISLMLAGQKEYSGKTDTDPNSKAPEGLDEKDINSVECEDSNYSTYCVAKTLLTRKEDGYMEYVKAQECHKSLYFDSVAEKDWWDLYMDDQEDLMFTEEYDKWAHNLYQSSKAQSMSVKTAAIDAEIGYAKQTLDVTLATYDELKTAWAMHEEYKAIYENLVKYRDKMVEIRHQVEEMPGKFIDATTTMCT